MKVADSLLEVSWDRLRGHGIEINRTKEADDLVSKVLDLVVASAEHLESNGDGLLVLVLWLEVGDLVLASGELVLDVRVGTKLVLELSSSHNQHLDLVLSKSGQFQVLWVGGFR